MDYCYDDDEDDYYYWLYITGLELEMLEFLIKCVPENKFIVSLVWEKTAHFAFSALTIINPLALGVSPAMETLCSQASILFLWQRPGSGLGLEQCCST